MLLLSLTLVSSLMPPASPFMESAEANTGWVDIATREDLDIISEDPSGNYRLIQDIDMGEEVWLRGITFEGHLDGQGYKIENLKTVNRKRMSGLFQSIIGEGLVENLVLEVEIEDAGDIAGGLASELIDGTISNVYVTGTLSNTGPATGGVVGLNNGKIMNSASAVQIQGSSDTGGVAGVNQYNGTISNSYATGSVTGEEAVGGLVGRNEFGTITNSYAAGVVMGSKDMGGLLGDNSGTITNSYWDTDATGQDSSAGGTGLSGEEMKHYSSFTGWDFSEVWHMEVGESYPGLQAFTRFPGLAQPIHTIADLMDMHEEDAAYRLMNDLDFGSYIGNWTPINFHGYFDGNGHKVHNLNLSTNLPNTGLFGLNTGVIKNLVFENIDVEGRYSNTGGLVGSNRGTIEYVSVNNGTVVGDSSVGGLAGVNSGTIRNSHAAVTVSSSEERAGGLVGHVEVLEEGISRAEVIDSYATGNVAGTLHIGGLIGRVGKGGSVRGSYAAGQVSGVYDIGGLIGSNEGTIQHSYATGQVTDGQQERFGGLIGSNGGDGMVLESFASGDVTGRYDVGGLIGLNEGMIRNAYAMGDVYASGNAVDAPREYAGGLIGRNLNDGTLERTFAAGAVSGHRDRPEIVGGLLGGNANADPNAVMDSYWNTDTSRLSTSAGGEGRTTEELVHCDTFIGWDETVWEQDCDAQYPKLKNIDADDDMDFVALKPLVTPPAGLHNQVEVELDGEAGATFYYTLDGSDPDPSSQLYTEPFPITETSTLKVIQQDQAGNVSAVAVVDYEMDKEAPTVVELYPVNGSQGIATETHLEITFSEAIFLEAGNILIKRASDHQLVEAIDIVGSQVTMRDANSVLIEPSDVLLENTGYYIQVEGGAVRDEAGNSFSGISDASTWEFQTRDAHAPAIQSVSVPADGRYKEGDMLSFAVAFQEEVVVHTSSGNPRLELMIGSSVVYAVYESGSGTSQLQFSYTIEPGQEDADGIQIKALDLNHGTIRDLYGNHADLTLHGVEETYGVKIDSIRPVITLHGTPSVTLEKGQTYTDAGAEATDNIDGDLSASITMTSPVDETAIGTYTVIYEVTDLAGNRSDPVTREVNVIPNAVEVEGSVGLPQTIDVRSAETGALLSLFSADDHPISTGTADLHGQFRFEGVPYGSGYTVTQEVYGLQSPPSASVSVLQSGDAQLSGLSISEGTLVPSFSATTDAYQVEVPHHVHELTVTASVYAVTTSVAIDGSPSSERTILLQVGENRIPIVATAQDGTTQAYDLLVIRSTAPREEDTPDPREDQDQGAAEPNPGRDRTAFLLVAGDEVRIDVTIAREFLNGIKQDKVSFSQDNVAKAIQLLEEQGQSMLKLSIPTREEDPADETIIAFSSLAVQELISHDFSLKLQLDDVSIHIEADSLADHSDSSSDDMTWTFAKVTDADQLTRSDAILDVLARNSVRIGPSMDIKQGSSIRTKVSLPLDYLKLPEDSEELKAYLSRFRVLIEHSDGENLIQPGLIEYDEEQDPAAVSVYVDRFSTFTLIEDPPLHERLSDIRGHWGEEAIRELVRRDVVSGFPDRTFRPDEPITRGEFITLLIKAFEPEAQNVEPAGFTDIQGHWAEESIQLAYNRGLILGYADRTFRPDERLTREQMAVMMVHTMDGSPSEHVLQFADRGMINEWALEDVRTAVQHGVMTGYLDNTFKPQQTATRVEAITMIFNGLQHSSNRDKF